MSNIIHQTPVQPHEAGSFKSSDIKQAREAAASMTLEYKSEDNKTPIPNAALVDELCNFLGKEYTEQFNRNRNAQWVNPEDRPNRLPQVKVDDGGFARVAVTKDDFERALAPWKYALGELMSSRERDNGESIADYRTRLCLSSGEPWRYRMQNMAICAAHIHRIADEERTERKRIAGEERQAKREERELLERQASPDSDEIKRLLGIVEGAAVSETFLQTIMDALNMHRAAEYAREHLRSIFDAESRACAQLGKQAKPRPDIRYGTAGAHEFAQIVKSANAAQPRIPR
jgi:hypothetical protein